MSKLFSSVVQRELLLVFRQPTELLNPIAFFILAIMLFPLGIGPEANTLKKIAPGVIWVAALLSAMLSLERLFKDDFSDGWMEQQLLSAGSLHTIVCAKVFSHWLVTGLPIVLVAPLLALLLGMNMNSFVALELTLLLGTPILSLIGAIAVSITVSINKGGVLLSLLLLPLYIPLLIFATSAVDAASFQMPYSGHLAMIGAILVLAMTLAPFAIAKSLKLNVS